MRSKRLTPMLNVSDVEPSLGFYQKVAGFELASPCEAAERWRWAWIKSVDKEFEGRDADVHILRFGPGTDESPTNEGQSGSPTG